MSTALISVLGWILATLLVGVLWRIKPSWRPVTGPLFGALTAGLAVYLFGKRAVLGQPEGADQAEPTDTSPEPPEYLDAMSDAVPDGHPSVTPERRERAERGAAEAIRFDDASKAERDDIDAELAEEVRDILDN